jgi:hypothetical protein
MTNFSALGWTFSRSATLAVQCISYVRSKQDYCSVLIICILKISDIRLMRAGVGNMSMSMASFEHQGRTQNPQQLREG